MSTDLKEPVAEALKEIRSSFAAHRIEHEPDGQGGAFVRVHDVEIGISFRPSTSWIGFQITFQYPFADVYPHYIRPDVSRVDGRALSAPLHINNSFPVTSGAVPAVMVSRRSNHRDPVMDTAVVKLAKVLAWLRSQ